MKSNKNGSFELLSLKEVFSNRFFIIPDYQRGYSWEEEQIEDLIKDIENIVDKKHKHFTGTIVAAKKENYPDFFDIVDGQQRITTLVILLREIYNTNTKVYHDLKETFFSRGNVGSERNVLTMNEETRIFFNDKILGNGSPIVKTKSHSCISKAQGIFKKWLAEESDKPQKIYEAVTNYLGFILFTPENDKEIGIMFEVINNRGKKLSELEKIKNYFIYFATIYNKDSLRQTINDKWRDIQENLSNAGKTSNEDENSFLRFAYVVFYEANKEKSHAVYEQMKIRYSPHELNTSKIDEQVKEMQNFVVFLANASLYYSYFFNSGQFKNQSGFISDQKIIKRIDKSLSYLRCHPVNASIMPVFLAVMNSFNQPLPLGFIDLEKRVADLLEIIEKTNFRLYVLPGVFNRADTKQGDLFYFANEFHRCPDWDASQDSEPERARFNGNVVHKGNIFDWLETELKEMIYSQCNVKRFVEVLTLDKEEEYDYYNWRDGLRFFLSCYEEEKKKDNKLHYDIERMLKLRSEVKENLNEYLSIEHIWARENLNQFYDPWQIEKRRLGNFVLMGMSANISQQADDIPIKIDRLRTENHVGRGSLDLHQIDELKLVLEEAFKHPNISGYSRKTHKYYKELATVICDLRETTLIKFALKRWGLPKDDIKSFVKIDSFDANSKGLAHNYQFQ